MPYKEWIPALFLWTAIVLMIGCDSSSADPEVPPGPTGPSIARIVVSPDDRLLVSMGQELQLEALVTTTVGDTLVDPALDWSSSDAAVLTVTDAGLMMGQADGTATVTAALGGQAGTLTFRVVALTGTWIGSEPPDTVNYILTQTGTSVDGTFQSVNGFPPITDVNTGVLSGSLTFERYIHFLTLTTETGCELRIFGGHSVRVEESGALILEPIGPGSLSSLTPGCNIQGTILFVTLRRQ